jgi:hypothetical protein
LAWVGRHHRREHASDDERSEHRDRCGQPNCTKNLPGAAHEGGRQGTAISVKVVATTARPIVGSDAAW